MPPRIVIWCGRVFRFSGIDPRSYFLSGQAEARLTEIAALRNAKISYAKYKPLYDAYRKSGYNKKYLQTHSEEIKIFRAAKEVFDTHKDEKIPSVKELNAMFAEVLTQKKEYYAKYRRASELHREALVNRRNYAAILTFPTCTRSRIILSVSVTMRK